MAVAAYASVLSLLRVIYNVQHPSRLRLFPDTTAIDALQEKLCFLQHFFEVQPSTVTEAIECVARKIPKVTYDAETLIDNYVIDQLYREVHPENDVVYGNLGSFHDEIHRVIRDIDSINEELTTPGKIQHDQEKPTRVLDKFTGDKPLKNKMVGFDDQLNQVLEKLTGNQPNLVIISIVGMGGIGKTTLARSLFHHPYNMHHFQVRIWLTISLNYSVKKVLKGLLNDGVLRDKKGRDLGDESESELITQLHQKLYGQRYLIVLDDVWSLDAWYDLKRGFPNNGKGSRVLVTTRLFDIANSLDSRNNTYSMKFLDEDKSWDLFSEKAFEKGGRSSELEEVGKEISIRCKGLPLLLVLVGGLLANSNMKVEYWKNVAEDITSFANSAYDEYSLRILWLSYHHLPIHLKLCFLCMGHFDEDSNIKVSKLIKRWVAQGIVKPAGGKSLEEAARKYLEDLVGRNMLLIRKRSRSGNIKCCGIHDLLRDLSIKESYKEQLLELPKTISVRVPYIKEVCLICDERKKNMTTFNYEYLRTMSDGEIMVCSSCESTFQEFARSRFVVAVEFESENIPLPTMCRSIVLSSDGSISVLHTIRLIWNLEFIHIEDHGAVLPKELWEMPQLRHVKVWSFTLPDPLVSTTNDVIVLENLHTLTKIMPLKFTDEVVRRIPNLRKLCMREHIETDEEEDWSSCYLQNLAHLQKLESLSASISFTMEDIAFPYSLKKLKLRHCRIAWEDLTIIGSLPNLEVLKLCFLSIKGDEWNPIEGEFLRLKFLKLENLYLLYWGVDGTHFPALEVLVLNYTLYLKEIPREIGELPSLNSIYLKQSGNKSIIDSARDVVEEQLGYGNERLVVYVEELGGETYQIGGANHGQ